MDGKIYERHSASRVKSFIVTTEGTRKICTDPSIVGNEYMHMLRQPAETFLRSEHFMEDRKRFKDHQFNVLHFLRGGLSYGLIEALNGVGVARPNASFMSSERYKEGATGAWKIRDDNYVKFTLSSEFPSVILVGDIVATGSTLDNGLDRVVKACETDGARVSKVLFFTIGCDNAVKILEKYDERLRGVCKDYEGCACVFYEGVFKVATDETPVTIKTTGTDLLNLGAELAPEYTRYLGTSPMHVIQKCVIYDGGSRAFEPRKHFDEVIHYFRELLHMMHGGMHTYDLVTERWEGAKEFFTDKDFNERCGEGPIENLITTLQHYRGG